MSTRPFGRIVVAAVLCGGLAPAHARAWGEEGHVIVAKIAELNLKPQARKAIQGLLGPIPISHPKIATYADFVRRNPDFPQYADSAPWHFVDIPFDAKGYDPTRDCPEGTCILGQMERFKKALAGNGKSDERLEALLFLVHFVGDVHQPLHCANRNDRGGNDLHVRYLGKSGKHINLHSVWDVDLVRAGMGGLDPVDYAHRLNAQISKEDRQQWQAGEPKDWAEEAHAIAVNDAYQANGKELPRTGHPDLDRAYVDRCQPL